MHPPVETSPDTWALLLRARGLRATSGRIAALCYIESRPHISAAEIHEALAAELPSISQQSAHNIVHDLSECGILRRVDLPGSGSARYETHRGDNHHHLQCLVCQRIEDVPCTLGAAPCLAPSETHGMRILEASVTFRGICATCQPAYDAAHHTSPTPTQTEGKEQQ